MWFAYRSGLTVTSQSPISTRRNGNLGTYKQSKESLVPRSRRTDRENAKIPRNERTEESTVETQNNPVNDDEVKIEDFLTLVKEESNSMPVSYKILTGWTEIPK